MGTYDITSEAFFADPDPTLDRMRAHDPVHWHSDLRAFILTRYDDVFALLRDTRFSVSRGDGGVGRCADDSVADKLEACNAFFSEWLVYSDPPRHTALRAVAARAFSPQMVEQLRGTTVAVARELLAPALLRGRLDVVRDFAMPLPAVVSCEMLGLPRERLPEFQRWGDDLFALFRAKNATREIVERTHAALEACEAYFGALIAERTLHPGNDLISGLALARTQEGRVSPRELVGMCVMLMAGAHELTSHAIANGTLALLDHPAELRRLKEDPSLIGPAVEEVLRFQGPTFRAYRRALVDVELRGVRVAAGQEVYGILHAANHDPAHFEAPERFDIRRRDNRHLGLGTGVHVCLAAALVRLQTQIALEMLVDRTTDLRLQGGRPTWSPNMVTRGLRSLMVTFSAPTDVHAEAIR